MQNLGCGVFEVTKKDPDADSDDSDDDEGLKQLKIPSAQTAGMAAAQRAGRVLGGQSCMHAKWHASGTPCTHHACRRRAVCLCG